MLVFLSSIAQLLMQILVSLKISKLIKFLPMAMIDEKQGIEGTSNFHKRRDLKNTKNKIKTTITKDFYFHQVTMK